MKLEIGKAYKTRAGTKAIVEVANHITGVFWVRHEGYGMMNHAEDGYFVPIGISTRWDLISEWSEK